MSRKETIVLKDTPWKVEMQYLGESSGVFSKPCYWYCLLHDNEPIFDGSDYQGSPMMGKDVVEHCMDMLGFLSCGKDDVDEDFFEEYTKAQLAWRDRYAEELALVVNDWEQRADSPMPMTAYMNSDSHYVVEYTD